MGLRHSVIGFVCGLVFLLTPSSLHTQTSGPANVPLKEAISRIATPKDLVRFMRKNFQFIEDRKLFGMEDYWQSPEEFWSRKAGDCEDYALFTKWALSENQIIAYVVSFYGANGYAHTVAIYEEDGHYNVINEDRLYTHQTATIEEAVSRVYPSWLWGGIAERRGSRGWMLQEIRNPAARKTASIWKRFLKLFPK